jgi:predicted negative regulator of RcsB-dependent stress response
MDYKAYVQETHRASQLVERGDYAGAAAILQQLLAQDISNVDKAMMCLNLAIVSDKQGRVEEALDWYAEGAYYEGLHQRHYVAEKRAVYLAAQGRYRESREAYEALLKRPGLTEGDKARMRGQIEQLRGRRG